MENNSIDKIAGGLVPERSEGSLIPRGVGAELPHIETDLQYEVTRSIGEDGSVSGGPGVLYTPGSKEYFFIERNTMLEEGWKLLPVRTPEEYFDILFSRVDVETGEKVNYMQATGEEYYGDHHYNAIVYDLRTLTITDRETGESRDIISAKKYDITRSMDKCFYIEGPHCETVISSPVLYAGKTRSSKRARTIWGIAIDLDDVRRTNLNDLHLWINKLGYTPMPSMIVSSGSGLHLYYLFPRGVKCYPQTVKLLQRLKHNMTRALWSPYFSSDGNPQLGQGIWQGFRIPGTPTKMKDLKVVGFVPEEIPYYTAKELNNWFRPVFDELVERDNRPLTEEETDAIDHNKYIPSKMSFPEARALYPDWNPNSAGKKLWVCNRGLYDWWLNKLKRHDSAVKTGHRYSCIMALVAFAKKCNIPYEEIEADAYSLVEWLDSLTTDPDNHFKPSDVHDALTLYDQEDVGRYSKRYLEYHTNIEFGKNRRNGRTRKEHLEIMNAIRAIKGKNGTLVKRGGPKEQKINVGMWSAHHPYVSNMSICARELNLDLHTVSAWWPDKSPRTIPEAVLLWRHDHPGIENKSLCARDCGISRPTVIKWWNCTAEDAKAEFDRLKAIQMAGLAAINAKKAIDGYEMSEEQPSELHDLGAEFNTGYITDKKIAAITMQNSEGYSEQDADTIRNTGDELTDSINFGELNMEELARAMGFPEYLIPMLKVVMQTPGFWEEYHKANPSVNMSNWPPAARKAYDAAIAEHNKKK